MIKLKITIILSLVIIIFIPQIAFGDVTLPWSTTFNCADWTAPNTLSGCDGLAKAGDWACSDGTGNHYEMITAPANMSGGAGGKGQRHWIGDGTNNTSGDISIPLNPSRNEIWLRFYMRYELGLAWNGGALHYNKIIYIDSTTNPRLILGYDGGDSVRVYCYGTSWYIYSANGTGFKHIMGGDTGDGLWHLYEWHIKMDTNGSNGVTEVWIDGVRIINATNANFGGSLGYTLRNIEMGNNADYGASGRCMAVDFDDVAISTTGYIGPLFIQPDTTPPAAPSGVTVS